MRNLETFFSAFFWRNGKDCRGGRENVLQNVRKSVFCVNYGKNHLYDGEKGFNKRVFDVTI